MKLPEGVDFQRRTDTFDQDSIPKGLLRAHRTKSDTWGRIVVEEGELLYRRLEPDETEERLSPDHPGVIEPGQLHEVAPLGAVRFHVEFYR